MQEASDSSTTPPLSSSGEAVVSKKKKVCRPFLKWAGGKGALLEHLTPRIPYQYNRYFEPFLGGAALFFALCPQKAFLSDINPELVNTYTAVQENVNDLIVDLQKHVYEKEYYYKIRNIDRTEEFQNWAPPQKASRFIYLNRTCFNGLHRVNSRGEFNVPFGRYTNPKIVDAENLSLCSTALKKAKISIKDFRYVLQKSESGDFVYFDPPYVPVNKTSSFTSFHESGFGEDMQKELAKLCSELDKKGVSFLLSNSSVPLIHSLYSNFRIETISAPRAINSKGNKRGGVEEVLVRNY